MHQYAYTGLGTSIHSSAQLEWYKNDVNDRSIKVGGLQRITTLEGYVIPLNIIQGLPRMTIRPYTDKEWEELPHVILTSEIDWDPGQLDLTLEDDENWYDAISDLAADPFTNLFDEYGDYRHRVEVQSTKVVDSLEDIIDRCVHTATAHDIVSISNTTLAPSDDDVLPPTTQPRTITAKDRDYQALRPLFGWLPTDTIKRTFEATTQYARIPMSTILKKHFQSPNPALMATDTIYSDTPAIDSGVTTAQFFVGCDSMLCDVYGMKTDKQFVNTLEDNIRERGAPTKLVSDRAQVEISAKVQDILRTLFIGHWQSEPHQQHQNPAERRFQTVKTTTNTILDFWCSCQYLVTLPPLCMFPPQPYILCCHQQCPPSACHRFHCGYQSPPMLPFLGTCLLLGR